MNDTSDVTIKLVTQDLPPEFKLFLYTLLWTICTFNMWLYVKILNEFKNLLNKNKRTNYSEIIDQDLNEVTE